MQPPSRRILLLALQEEASRHELRLDADSLTWDQAQTLCQRASRRTGLPIDVVRAVLDEQRLGNIKH